jgi:outer membrane receptor protein involved in Fe transport
MMKGRTHFDYLAHLCPSKLPMVIASLLAAPAANATEQETSSEMVLEEVVVTATKRAANLMDIPQSIQAISAVTIQQAGLYSMDDYVRFIPSMSYVSLVPGQAGSGPSQDLFPWHRRRRGHFYRRAVCRVVSG